MLFFINIPNIIYHSNYLKTRICIVYMFCTILNLYLFYLLTVMIFVNVNDEVLQYSQSYIEHAYIQIIEFIKKRDINNIGILFDNKFKMLYTIILLHFLQQNNIKNLNKYANNISISFIDGLKKQIILNINNGNINEEIYIFQMQSNDYINIIRSQIKLNMNICFAFIRIVFYLIYIYLIKMNTISNINNELMHILKYLLYYITTIIVCYNIYNIQSFHSRNINIFKHNRFVNKLNTKLPVDNNVIISFNKVAYNFYILKILNVLIIAILQINTLITIIFIYSILHTLNIDIVELIINHKIIKQYDIILRGYDHLAKPMKKNIKLIINNATFEYKLNESQSDYTTYTYEQICKYIVPHINTNIHLSLNEIIQITNSDITLLQIKNIFKHTNIYHIIDENLYINDHRITQKQREYIHNLIYSKVNDKIILTDKEINNNIKNSNNIIYTLENNIYDI